MNNKTDATKQGIEGRFEKLLEAMSELNPSGLSIESIPVLKRFISQELALARAGWEQSLPKESPKSILIVALQESLKLQAHYGMLINDWDGGTRKIFKSVPEWLNNLKSLGAFDGLDIPSDIERLLTTSSTHKGIDQKFFDEVAERHNTEYPKEYWESDGKETTGNPGSESALPGKPEETGGGE